MNGKYVVALYEGRLSVRFVPSNSTTVYMDREVAEFDDIDSANKFCDDFEDEFYTEYQAQGEDDWGDDLDYYCCDDCGALHSKDCNCI